MPIKFAASSADECQIELPDCDTDVHIIFPSGACMTIQARPSNGHDAYAGSLDIILPDNQNVTLFEGDDLTNATSRGTPNTLFAKQIVCELPGDHSCQPKPKSQD